MGRGGAAAGALSAGAPASKVNVNVSKADNIHVPCKLIHVCDMCHVPCFVVSVILSLLVLSLYSRLYTVSVLRRTEESLNLNSTRPARPDQIINYKDAALAQHELSLPSSVRCALCASTC